MVNHKRAEEMATFFDLRADEYDAHMQQVLPFEAFYGAVTANIRETTQAVTMLDIGCGTGIELAGIFSKAPNAVITGIDLSEKMLDVLQQKYAGKASQLCLHQCSYFSFSFPVQAYDYVLAVQTMHHFLPATKADLYAKIYRALVQGGVYIEGDYVVAQEQELAMRAAYQERDDQEALLRHIDIPCSIDTQRQLLSQAGFSPIDLTYHAENVAVFVGYRA